MKNTHKLILVFILCLAVLPVALALEARTGLYMLPQGEDSYFAVDHYTSMEFVAFFKDGSYRRINREHMFVAIMDQGRWKQSTDGELLMCSSHTFRDIWYGDVGIYLKKKEDLERLPAIGDKIKALLKKSSGKEIQVEGVIDGVSSIRKKAKRKDLEGITKEIDKYLKGKDENLFKARPGKYNKHFYLVMLSDGFRTDITNKEIRQELDSLKSGQVPGNFLFYRINGTAFEKETKKAQPFMFYPDMNDCVKKAGTPIMDMKGPKLEHSQCKGF